MPNNEPRNQDGQLLEVCDGCNRLEVCRDELCGECAHDAETCDEHPGNCD